MRPWDDPSLTNAGGGDGSDIGAVEFRPPHTVPPEFILIETTSAGQRLCVQGVPFASYQLQRSDETGAGTFANHGTPRNSDTLGLVDFTDPAPLPPRSFYRVMATP